MVRAYSRAELVRLIDLSTCVSSETHFRSESAYHTHQRRIGHTWAGVGRQQPPCARTGECSGPDSLFPERIACSHAATHDTHRDKHAGVLLREIRVGQAAKHRFLLDDQHEVK